MEWKDVAVLFAVLGGMGTMWWKIDAKFDALSKLLNDNLIQLAHTPSPPSPHARG